MIPSAYQTLRPAAGSAGKCPRVGIVVSHPIQHFCPFYRALAADGRIDLRVLFGSVAGSTPYHDKGFGQRVTWQPNILDGFDSRFLPGAERRTILDRPIDNPSVSPLLQAFDADAVQVYGFYHPIALRAVWWAKRRHRKVLYCADSENMQHRSARTRLRKRLTLPWMFRAVDGFLTVGDCNEEYYRHYGVSNEKLFRSPYPVDEIQYRTAMRDRVNARARIRAAHHLPDDAIVVLYVGKLVQHKAVEDAIRAVAGLWKSGRHGSIYLLLAGDGPERRNCESVASLIEPRAVRFAGFVPAESLPDYYIASDLLLHPSRVDPHPVATSEAVVCGLPVIASDRVGSVGPTDDVRVGRNGWVYKFGDVAYLQKLLIRLIAEPHLLEAAGRESLSVAREREMSVCVDGFVRAVTACLNS